MIDVDVCEYKPPKTEMLPKFARLRVMAKSFLCEIGQQCPPCSDRTSAIRKVREALMAANAAVVLEGREAETEEN